MEWLFKPIEAPRRCQWIGFSTEIETLIVPKSKWPLLVSETAELLSPTTVASAMSVPTVLLSFCIEFATPPTVFTWFPMFVFRLSCKGYCEASSGSFSPIASKISELDGNVATLLSMLQSLKRAFSWYDGLRVV